ncbi:MAG TPA: hypothetical protein VIY48_01485 [Candidatus Paceibacterota bacterium]
MAEIDTEVVLYEALMDCTGHLAAAISLLERIPNAKKVAASDKIFEMMLSDYRKSLERARNILKDC